MANKRILIFSTAYLPLIGGAEIAIKEITDRIGDEFEFDMITARLRRNFPREEKIGSVNVYRIGFGIELLDKLLVPFLGAIKTIRLSRARGYSCYWCVMASFASGAAFISNWFQKRVPIVLTLQEGDSEAHLRYRWAGLLNLSWKLALRYTHHLTAISNYLLERARKLGYRGQASLIPNGVDIEKFRNPHLNRENNQEIILVTTSRLVEKNAVGDIITALKFLPEKVKLRVIGSGPLEKTLRKQSDSLGVSSRVEFFGTLTPDEIPKELHRADIFVRPSLSEGMGNSFIEAMAAGIPVIATPVGGIVDFLRDGETGLFVEPESPRLIAFQVQKLIKDRVLRDKITIAARRMVEERYDWDFVSEEMRDKVFNTL